MRVGVDRTKYSIQIPLPPRIDPTVTMMTVEDKPDVTYDDVGGAGDALEKLREVGTAARVFSENSDSAMCYVNGPLLSCEVCTRLSCATYVPPYYCLPTCL